MQLTKHVLSWVTVLAASSAFAEAVPEIRCTDGQGFSLHLAIDYQTSLGVMT